MSVPLLDYGDLEGGLARMMDRYRDTGSMIGDAEADAFVAASSEAVLLGLLFDQRVRAEFAFTGPKRLHDRIGTLDFRQIAAMDVDALRETFAVVPTVHRFTNKMAEMTHALATYVVEHYDGAPERLWNDGCDAATLQKRARALPGFGADKSMKLKFALHYFRFRDFSSTSD
ncbi:MAG: hypothetical protein LCH53_06940 [Bacteroidetes bacterium]|nr:hypothetical protein [Bacteroidota bacterium]